MSLAPRFTITNGITSALTRIERARGFLDGAQLSEDWIRRMRDRAFVLEAHHTTHIEGTHLTLEQSERLLAGEAVPEVDPDDARELLNYRAAFDLVSGYLGVGGPINEGLIREIHRHLVEGVRGGSAAPGTYRAIQNYIVNSATRKIVYTPPPAHDVPILVQELVAWVNGGHDVHPVLAAGIAQFQLVHIHPFLDGNGRTSRLLSTLLLYRAGYDFKRLFSISEYYDRDRPLFYRALQAVREQDMDLTGWVEYFTEGLATQLDEVKSRGERVIRSDVVARTQGLTDRQSKALAHLFDHGHIALQDFVSLAPQVDRRTLQRDLKALLDKGLIVEHGSSSTDPNRRYLLARSLVEGSDRL